jgi:hypothetical protein
MSASTGAGVRYVDPRALPAADESRRRDWAPGLLTPWRAHGPGGRGLRCFCGTCTDAFRLALHGNNCSHTREAKAA